MSYSPEMLVESGHEESDPNHYLVDALQQLDFKRRTVVVLRFYGDYQPNEIAEMMAIPEGTVKIRIFGVAYKN